MSSTKELSQLLRSRGFRMTPQRHVILNILKGADGYLSPVQVYEQAHQALPGISETTVYRTLEFLVKNEVVQPAMDENRHLVYEIADHVHHHLICSSCGAQVNIDPDTLQTALTSLEKQTGYRLNASHITLFGLCPICKPDLEKNLP
jgi:Fur family ferric uptake transcriptional regulator